MKIDEYTLMEITLENVCDNLEEVANLIDTSEDEEWSKDFNKAWQIIEELRASMIYCFKIEKEPE